ASPALSESMNTSMFLRSASMHGAMLPDTSIRNTMSATPRVFARGAGAGASVASGASCAAGAAGAASASVGGALPTAGASIGGAGSAGVAPAGTVGSAVGSGFSIVHSATLGWG
ncbi:MAG: hypothetical protein AVDCRST_MAG11-3469, partial [uncultured Gemmatimonadaceae bacterium]